MANSVVFVTATDYVIVYPSTQVQATSSPLRDGTKSMKNIPSATLISMSTSEAFTTSLISSPTSTATTVPLGPSESKSKLKSIQWNDSFTILALSAVVLLVVILLSLCGYAIYLRCKGRCVSCSASKAKLKKWETGELKIITSGIDVGLFEGHDEE
ncbi:hypothetical protein GQ44DRAFT_707002 [Phaeosphaeriaceae sp. PMI808]|nr:hypothetical protein GQ44DRAFT_707002 [Phaeosphaeriaceae sp. PMI808]